MPDGAPHLIEPSRPSPIPLERPVPPRVADLSYGTLPEGGTLAHVKRYEVQRMIGDSPV